MHPFRSLTFFCLAFVLAALSVQAFANSTVGLCAGPGIHYLTIQQAVNASKAGGTVDVCPGTYAEQVTINKSLTLIGVGPTASTVVVPVGGLVVNATDIFSFPTAAQIFAEAGTITVSHMTVDGANNGLSGGSVDPVGIYYQNASGTITDNAVRNTIMDTAEVGYGLGLGINVEADIGYPLVTITNNSVRNYDKNGITVSGQSVAGEGPKATISGNTVIGIGATALIAQNGIQIGYGASATVTSNYVVDDIYTGGYWGSSGILIYGSAGVTVTSNTVESTQIGIVPVTESASLLGNGTTIKSNHIGGTQTFDAIDVCSDGNTVQGNVIYGSSQDGIHLDD